MYYVEASGEKWRLYDCVMKEGKLRRVDLGSRAAICRVFVSPDKTRLAYMRRRGEDLPVTAIDCRRMLAAAEYLATEAFRPEERTAR